MAESAATTIKGGRGWRVGVIILSVISWVPCLYLWPAAALINGVIWWPIPVAYLAVVTSALLAWCYRSCRIGLRVDEHGMKVRNFWWTYRFRWAEVRRLVDGRAAGGEWALVVVLYDGRAITAAATESRPASPPTLSALKQAAARHLVTDGLKGVAAERPHAWLDPAAAARRYQSMLAAWLPTTAISLAGLAVLIAWNLHHPHYGPVFVPVGFVAVTGMTITPVVWFRWRRALRPAQARDDRYGEGVWFGVPLGRKRHAAGVITRKEPRSDGVMLGYFFAPFDGQPALGQLAELYPADAMLIVQFIDFYTGEGGAWTLLGHADGWDRAAWPVPAFARTDRNTRRSFKVVYDDQLRFVQEEPIDHEDADGLPAWECLGGQEIRERLNRLLRRQRTRNLQ